MDNQKIRITAKSGGTIIRPVEKVVRFVMDDGVEATKQEFDEERARRQASRIAGYGNTIGGMHRFSSDRARVRWLRHKTISSQKLLNVYVAQHKDG